MNEIQLKILEDLFAMVPEGTFRDVEELQEFIEDEGTEDLFEMLPEGVFESEEQFGEFLNGSPSISHRLGRRGEIHRYGLKYQYPSQALHRS